VWVWNGLHAFAPQAATLLVDILDKLTSCVTLDMQNVQLPLPAKEQPANEQPQQQQQQQQQQVPEQPVTLQDSTEQQQQQQQLLHQQIADRSEQSVNEQKQQPAGPDEAGEGVGHSAAAGAVDGHQPEGLPEVKLSVVEQRWRFAQMTLLVAAAATLVALGKDPGSTAVDASVGAKAAFVGGPGDRQLLLQEQQPWQQHEPWQQ
jgi:hypothetical protein